MSSRLSRAGAPFLLVLIVAGLYWKLFTRQYTWMDHPDMARQILPWLQFQAAAWHRGEFPLWDPHVWGGQPLLAQLQPGAAYPLNWPLFLLPLRNGHINLFFVQLSFVFAHLLAALFCYVLCRDLERSRAASILAGTAFSAAGLVGWIKWPQFLNGAIWMPLVILFFFRSARGQRPLANAALSGTFLGVSFLSGHHQIPTFVALAMAGLWIAEGVRRRAAALAPAAGFLLFAALGSAFQMLPAIEYGMRALRWVGAAQPVSWSERVPYNVHAQFSLLPSNILGLVLPGLQSGGVFVGAAVVVLALAGFTAWHSRFEVRALGAMTVGGLLFALGGWSVFQGVAYLVLPMVEKARSPSMAIVVTQFAVAVLAAYGLDEWCAGANRLGRAWIHVLTAAGAAAWIAVAVAILLRPQLSGVYQQGAVLGTVALSLAAVLYACQAQSLPRGAAATLLLIVMAFELGTVVGQDFVQRDRPAGFLADLGSNQDLVAFLKGQPDFERLELDEAAIPYNIGDWSGIDTQQALLASLTANVANSGSAPSLFALTYYAGRAPIRPGQQLVFHARSGVNLYRNPAASPRAWIVHRAPELRQIKPAPPPLEDCETGSEQVRLTGKTANRVEAQVRLACRGMVILSETYDPGWRAWLDGRPVRLYQAEGVLRAVMAPAGDHRIELRYEPASAYAGATLTAVGLLSALMLGLSGLRRTRHARARKS